MKIAFIGMGEAATAFITGFGRARRQDIAAYDIKSRNPLTAAEIDERAAKLGINACPIPEEAVSDAQLVFSSVTADQAVSAAESYAQLLSSDAVWCDLNSCSPESKRQAHAIVEKSGARYLDVAVMAPVYPKLNMTPCLMSGPGARELHPKLSRLPMNIRVVGDDVGRASSIKMVRSIMVKGLEALTAECTLAAVAAGVEDEVFSSLASGAGSLDMPARAAYNFERTMVHGVRRSAEMDEVTKMLSDLGLPSSMSQATSDWQRRLGEMRIKLPHGNDLPNYDWCAEQILKRLGVE